MRSSPPQTVPENLDYFFIETTRGESAEDWKLAIEEILNQLFPDGKLNWWHPFTVGPRFQWRGHDFRAFRCPAGSVSCHLYMRAIKEPLGRVMLMTFTRGDSPVMVDWIENGTEKDFEAAELVAILRESLLKSRE